MKFVNTCGACPEQYDVFDDAGERVGYIRIRHGFLSIDRMPGYGTIFGRELPIDPHEDDLHLEEVRIASELVSSDSDGIMTSKERACYLAIAEELLS